MEMVEIAHLAGAVGGVTPDEGAAVERPLGIGGPSDLVSEGRQLIAIDAVDALPAVDQNGAQQPLLIGAGVGELCPC